MDAGLFLIIIIAILALLYVFDKVMNYIEYKQPKHMKKDEDFRL